jgi:hypothetical protein
MGKGPRAGFYYALAAFLLMLAGVFGPDVFDLSHTQKSVAFVLCLVGTAILIALGAIKEFQAERKEPTRGHKSKMISILGMLVSGVVFLGFACVYFWPRPDQGNSLDQTILFECRLSGLPGIMPEMPFYEIQLVGQEDADAGFLSFGQQPGEKLPWSDFDPKRGCMCKFTNFGSMPVFNVEVDIKIQYLESVKQENGTRSGDLIFEKTLTSPRLNLGTGDKNIAQLLYINRSPYYVRAVMFPTSARIQPLGVDQWQTVKLIPPAMPLSIFSLTPFEPVPINPPTEAQTPLAPPKPRSKK